MFHISFLMYRILNSHSACIPKLYLLLFLFLGCFDSYGQNWQEVDATYPSTAGYAGVGFYYDTPVYVRPGQKIGFEMSGIIYASVDVKFDGGSWQQVGGAGSDDFVAFNHPWSTPGTHSMEMSVANEGGLPTVHSYTVYVVPAAVRGFYDGGNRMIMWDDGDGILNNPFLVVEGFDPQNTSSANLYYQIGQTLFDEARNLGQDMIVLNFSDGGADLASNAQVVKDAVNYIDNIKSGSTPVKLAGVSMGGVISRYALAKAEEDGTPLNVGYFASIDSPQQGAVIDRDLQDYIKSQGVGGSSLTSPAAKQLLQYNAFDPDRGTNSSIHNQFYSELDGLDGNGYPENSKNIGVSFAPNTPNPNSGNWLDIHLDLKGVLSFADFTWKEFYFSQGDPVKKAGSYLPISTTLMWGPAPAPFWAEALTLYFTASFANFELKRYENPTFIPHESALDLKWDGSTRFDVAIFSETPGFHNEVPQDIVGPLLQEMGVGTPVFPPDKPQNFRITSTYSSYYDYPVSMEWDLASGAEKYHVFRCRIDSPVYSSCNTPLTHILTSYSQYATDVSLQMDDGSWGDGAALYQVEAVNAAGASVPSDPDMTYVKDMSKSSQNDRTAETDMVPLPEEPSLDQSTPNPGHGQVTIRYALPKASEVSLVVYDIMGREVSRLVDGPISAGFHDVQLDTSDLTSGIYLYRIESADFAQIRRMAITR